MFHFFRKPDPEQKERDRQAALLAHGRAVEGFLTDRSGNAVYYTYQVRGVTYTAAQDFQLPAGTEPEHLLGAVTVRYSPKNPANSMVLLTPEPTRSGH